MVRLLFVALPTRIRWANRRRGARPREEVAFGTPLWCRNYSVSIWVLLYRFLRFARLRWRLVGLVESFLEWNRGWKSHTYIYTLINTTFGCSTDGRWQFRTYFCHSLLLVMPHRCTEGFAVMQTSRLPVICMALPLIRHLMSDTFRKWKENALGCLGEYV